MPVAMIQDWADGGHSTQNYDAITGRMGRSGESARRVHRPHGGIPPRRELPDLRRLGSREHFERFMQDRLMPAVKEVVAAAEDDAPPPTTTMYDLRGFMVP